MVFNGKLNRINIPPILIAMEASKLMDKATEPFVRYADDISVFMLRVEAVYNHICIVFLQQR